MRHQCPRLGAAAGHDGCCCAAVAATATRTLLLQLWQPVSPMVPVLLRNSKPEASTLSLLIRSWNCATGVIDAEKKVRHSKLAERTEEVLTDPSKLKLKLKVRPTGWC